MDIFIGVSAMRALNIVHIIIIISLIISFSDALTVKSEQEKEEVDTRILGSGGSSGAKVSAPLVTVSEGLGGRETVHYETSPGDPIQIQKMVLPGNKKKYKKDDMLKICTEVKANDDIDGINVREFVSDDYSIVNISSCYIIKDLPDLDRYRDSLYDSMNSLPSELDGVVVHKRTGPNFISWSNLSGDSITQRKIAGDFLGVILGEDLNNITLIRKSNQSAVFEINGSVCSIDLFEYNNTAILKYEKSAHQLYLKRDKPKEVQIDEQTGKVIDKLYTGDIILSNLDNSFNVFVPSLNKRERLVYSYCIKPKSQFTISTITTIRVYDNDYSYYPDIDYPLDIEIFRPDYDVSASFNKYSILDTEKLRVKYNIYCEDLINNGDISLDVKLDDSLGNYELFDPDNKGKKILNSVKKLNLSSSKGANITYLIKFTDSGSYSLPAIKIDDKLYPFEKEISVQTKAEKYINWIQLFFAFLFIFMGEIFGKDISEYCNNKLCKKSSSSNLSIVPILFYAIIVIIIIVLLLLYWEQLLGV